MGGEINEENMMRCLKGYEQISERLNWEGLKFLGDIWAKRESIEKIREERGVG